MFLLKEGIKREEIELIWGTTRQVTDLLSLFFCHSPLPHLSLCPFCCTTCMLASDTHGSCVSTRRGMCRHAQPSFPISCPGLSTDRQAAMASPPPLSPPWKGEMNIGAPCQHQVFECCNKIMRTYRQPSTTTWRLANPLQAVPSLESTKRWHSRVIYLFFKGKCWMDHLYFIFPLHSKNFSFSFFPPSLRPHFSNTSPFPIHHAQMPVLFTPLPLPIPQLLPRTFFGRMVVT